VTAGEALNPAVASRWMDATGIAVAEAYGQTETLMTLINSAGVSPRIGSMGVAMAGLHLDVISAEGERLPPGTTGDLALLLPNPQLMLGYWGEPDRTDSCFLNGPDGRWFVTGDLAERDADGYFYHRGRNDDIINSAGYRIGPSEVENALLDHPAVQEAAAVGSPDLERGEIVKAFVVLRPGYEGDQRLCQALQTHVKQLTAPYKYPRAIEFVTDLPKTPTGKIRRVALREREKAGASRQPHSPAPPTI
jgi:acetyl-CoA synthetase